MAETIQEMMIRMQEENDYTDVRLPKTDLLGESVSIYLFYDGIYWTVKFGTCGSDTAQFCWVEDGELKADNTWWENYETAEEALHALDEQCQEMKKRNAILVSYEQYTGEGYAGFEEDED